MQPNIDLIDLLGALNAQGARYLIVDAYALALHGRRWATKAGTSLKAKVHPEQDHF